MKIDVLCLYEHKAREIESLCLLKEELALRGYKVKILSLYDYSKYYYKATVIVVPHLYDEYQLNAFANNKWHNVTKIVSLQWEQLLSKSIRDDDIHNPKEQAKKAEHIAWGSVQEERYLKAGIEKIKIWTIGSVSMDLHRSEFNRYFLSKEEIADVCGLEKDKEWILFISSFSFANISEETIKRWETMCPDTREFASISKKSYDIILNWLVSAAKENPHKIFIYRRHPAEQLSVLNENIKQIPNLKFIDDFSMRQWAKVADKFYNWFSTSLADIYFAKKNSFLLRPVAIPDYFDIDIFDDTHRISTYNEFISSLNHQYQQYKRDMRIEAYYGDGKGKMAYQKLADLCELLLKNEIKGDNYSFVNSNWYDISNTNSLVGAVKSWGLYALFKFCCLFRVNKLLLFKRKQNYLNIWKKEIYGIEEDIREYCEKLRPIVIENFENEK